MKELVGAGVAVVSALLYDLGYVLEKQALDAMPTIGLRPASVLRVARESRRWRAGFVAMLAGLALQVVALTLAPVSVVQPILAGGLVALAAAGSVLLGERLDRRHRRALVLVVVAVAVVSVSAGHGAPLAQHVPGGRFAVVVALAAGLAAVCAWAGVRRDGPPGRWSMSGLSGTALGAGLLYGTGAIAEKAVATRLVRDGMVRGAWSALATPYPWLFLVATLAGMLLFQVGLQGNPASLMASLTNVVSGVCALVGASVVFGEAVLPSGWWSVLRGAGFVSLLAAVLVLMVDPETVPTAGGPEPDRPGQAVAP